MIAELADGMARGGKGERVSGATKNPQLARECGFHVQST